MCTLQTKTRLGSLYLALALLVAVISTIFWTLGTAGQGFEIPEDGKTVRAGMLLYEENCASCHGKNLEGQPNWRQRNSSGRLPAPPHNKDGHTWHHADIVLFQLTKFGPQKFAGEAYQSDMPAYQGKLTDSEIIAILSFIKSTWPAKIRNRQRRINSNYSEKAK